MRGGAPGTRETDALDPVSLGGIVDAITLGGGSVYGLDAASGVMAWLGRQGRGFTFGPGMPTAPVVPAAIIFDLTNGGTKDWGLTPPYRALGLQAIETAAEDFRSETRRGNRCARRHLQGRHGQCLGRRREMA